MRALIPRKILRPCYTKQFFPANFNATIKHCKLQRGCHARDFCSQLATRLLNIINFSGSHYRSNVLVSSSLQGVFCDHKLLIISSSRNCMCSKNFQFERYPSCTCFFLISLAIDVLNEYSRRLRPSQVRPCFSASSLVALVFCRAFWVICRKGSTG